MDTKQKLKELQDGVASGDVLAINLKDYPDEKYYLELISGKRVRTLVTRVGSMILPIITAFLEENVEYKLQQDAYNLMLEDEEAPVVDAPYMSFMGIAAVISRELTNPEFDFVCDEILEGLYTITGELVDVDKTFKGKRAAILMLITELALKENILVPLVCWLENKGLTEINTFLQSLSTSLTEKIQTMY